MKDWKFINYDIIHFVLAGLYLVLGVLCIFTYSHRPKTNVSSLQRVFYPLLLFGVIIRSGFMGLQPFVREGMVSLPNQVNVVLNTLPSFILFSSYLIVLFIWVEMYLVMSGSPYEVIVRLPLIFNLLAFVMYTALVTLYILDFVLYPLQYNAISAFSNLIEKTIGIYDSSCFIFVSLAFLFYGICLILKFKSQHKNVNEEKRVIILRRVSALTVLLVLCFSARACITLFASIYMNLISGTWWWFDGAYYFGLEIVPISIMLYLLKMNNSANKDNHHHIHSNVNSYNHSRKSNGNEYSPLINQA